MFLDNAKEAYDIYIYAYSGKNSNYLEFNVSLRVFDEALRKLYYSLAVPYEITLDLDPNDKTYVDIKGYLETAINQIDLRDPRSEACRASVQAAQAYLDGVFYDGYCKESGVNAICIGPHPFDVAWLWTLAQTREKVLRSFSTVLTLMKKYPEYKFMSSPGPALKFLKEESPELYAEVKDNGACRPLGSRGRYVGRSGLQPVLRRKLGASGALTANRFFKDESAWTASAVAAGRVRLFRRAPADS